MPLSLQLLFIAGFTASATCLIAGFFYLLKAYNERHTCTCADHRDGCILHSHYPDCPNDNTIYETHDESGGTTGLPLPGYLR